MHGSAIRGLRRRGPTGRPADAGRGRRPSSRRSSRRPLTVVAIVNPLGLVAALGIAGDRDPGRHRSTAAGRLPRRPGGAAAALRDVGQRGRPRRRRVAVHRRVRPRARRRGTSLAMATDPHRRIRDRARLLHRLGSAPDHSVRRHLWPGRLPRRDRLGVCAVRGRRGGHPASATPDGGWSTSIGCSRSRSCSGCRSRPS